MRRDSETEVLVVGAGPVGMITALELAQAGTKVRIIDKATGDTTRAYACVLHARTMKLLGEFGLAEEIEGPGRKIKAIRCFNGPTEVADLDLERSGGVVTILPQNELEQILERKLAEYGINIDWAHRLSCGTLSGNHNVATVDELSSSGSGYAVPHFDQVIKRTHRITADFIVGADGHDSRVRDLLNVNLRPTAARSYYHMYEILSGDRLPDELRLIVDSSTVNSFTPLNEGRGRWIFEVSPEELPEDADMKDRGHFRIIDPRSGDLEFLKQLIESRAPWFDAEINEIEWHTTVSFQPRVAENFGRNGGWLAGDAAHVAVPIGMQSMNVGLCEGARLGQVLAAVLRGHEGRDALNRYDEDFRLEWDRLLNASDLTTETGRGGLPARRFLPCLPASAEQLEALFDQVGINFRGVRASRRSDRSIIRHGPVVA